jgi:oligoribonuclease
MLSNIRLIKEFDSMKRYLAHIIYGLLLINISFIYTMDNEFKKATNDKSKKNLWVWADCEMTGLDPDKEELLEVALVITNSDLDIIAVQPSIVINQREELLQVMDPVVKNMHTQSGLLKEVRVSRVTVKDAEAMLLAFVKQCIVEKESPLCGNSIYQDRRFLAKYMPQLNDYLHYRNIDVSTYKETIKAWYPNDKNCNFIKNKGVKHRALDDIKESIAELQHYRKYFLK